MPQWCNIHMHTHTHTFLTSWHRVLAVLFSLQRSSQPHDECFFNRGLFCSMDGLSWNLEMALAVLALKPTQLLSRAHYLQLLIYPSTIQRRDRVTNGTCPLITAFGKVQCLHCAMANVVKRSVFSKKHVLTRFASLQWSVEGVCNGWSPTSL